LGNAVSRGGVLAVILCFKNGSISKELSVAKAKDSKKGTRKKKNAIQQYFSETIGELRKVTWPTRKEATNLTIVVIIVTITMSILLGFLDFIYTKLFALILG
jgi:preprotein translocase subunit SecE